MHWPRKTGHLVGLVIFALLLVLVNSANKAQLLSHGSEQLDLPLDISGRDLLIAEAFANRQSDLMLAGEGRVVRVLPDDNKGSRHQKFLLQLESGHSLLISHNIDLAPRVETLREGEMIEFYGEYEWNDKGGVIHWTHHDPKGKHAGGWLRYRGKLYR